MSAKQRNYTDRPGFTDDFFRVRDFLKRIHEPGYKDENWLWSRWEYMFSHPQLDETHLSRIGVWEDGDKIVALANYEDLLGHAWFSFDKAYAHLKPELLDYAAQHLSRENGDGTKSVRVLINDHDTEFQSMAKEHGFVQTESGEPTSEYLPPATFPDTTPPKGFSIVTLADENDLRKIDRALWRGFDHPGEPPADGTEDRKKMQSGPDFRRDLTIAVKAPDGNFVSFCGMWYVRDTEYALVEPVATDPDYRGLGLGRCAVLEGIRRSVNEGAKVAYVGSSQEFYLRIGFRLLFYSHWWEKQV